MKDTNLIFKFDDSIRFELPGSGKSKPDCHTWQYIGHPDGAGVHYLKRLKSCHRRECPICYVDWAKREALSIFDRISAYNSIYHRKPVHYVVSPPQSVSYDNVSDFKSLRKKAYSVAKQRGIRGGVMIFHERNARTTDDRYKKIYCSDGPHFHILGDGWLSVKVKEFYLMDGWVVKNLRVRSNKDLIGTALYIMDHLSIPLVGDPDSGYPAISHSRSLRLSSVTWFGTMSYNKLKIPHYQAPGTIYCPICESEIDKNDWFLLDWIPGSDPPDQDFGSSSQGKDGFLLVKPLTGWVCN
jgi:hypothetical protein